MGFFDSLMKDPSGSGIYGQTKRNPSDDIGYINTLRERNKRYDENEGYRKAQFMSDLTTRQNRMNSIYGDNPMAPGMGRPGGPTGMVTGLNNAQMPTNFKEDPGRITDFQRAGLELKKEDIATDRAGINLRAKLGDERMGLDREKHDLDVSKNKNIYDTKQADLERKRDEANSRLAIAQADLERKKGDSAAEIGWHKAKMEADAAKHQLDLAQKDRQLADLNKFRDDTMAEKARLREQGSVSTTEAERDDEGNVKKTTTTKGKTTNPKDRLGIR